MIDLLSDPSSSPPGSESREPDGAVVLVGCVAVASETLSVQAAAVQRRHDLAVPDAHGDHLHGGSFGPAPLTSSGLSWKTTTNCTGGWPI
jgi:hypothetical protein